MNAKSEYQMAFRAMRKWWKLVDEHSVPPSIEREHFKNVCASYSAPALLGAIDSILARRKSEYFDQYPGHERAERRWKAQRWAEARNPQQEIGIPF